MPTYAYECNDCGHTFALAMSVDDMEKAKLRCPNCGRQRVEQVLEPVFVRTARKS